MNEDIKDIKDIKSIKSYKKRIASIDSGKQLSTLSKKIVLILLLHFKTVTL